MLSGIHKYPALLPFLFLTSGIVVAGEKYAVIAAVVSVLLAFVLRKTVFYAVIFLAAGVLLMKLHSKRPLEGFVGKRIRVSMVVRSSSIAEIDSVMAESGMLPLRARVGISPPIFREGTHIDAVGFVSQTDNEFLLGNGAFHSFDVEHLVSLRPDLSTKAVIREAVKSEIDEVIPDTIASGLLKAFLIGDRSGVPFRLKEDFKHAGIYHLFAISGLHIGILFTIFFLMMRFLRLGKNLSSITAGIILLGYAYVVGFSPSILRATVMAWAFILAYVIGRRSYPINTLALAGLITLTFNPFYVFHLGFQLSYLATFGILLFYPIYKRWKFRWLTIPMMASISAMVYTAPLLSHKFGYFSAVAPITSFVGGLLLWLAIAEFIAGMTTGVDAFYEVAQLAAVMLVILSVTFGRWRFSTIRIAPSVVGVAIWYVVITATGMLLRQRAQLRN